MNTKSLSTSQRKALKKLQRQPLYREQQARQKEGRQKLEEKLGKIAAAVEKYPGEKLETLGKILKENA